MYRGPDLDGLIAGYGPDGYTSLGITFIFTFTFSHLADAFIQSDLQLGNT